MATNMATATNMPALRASDRAGVFMATNMPTLRTSDRAGVLWLIVRTQKFFTIKVNHMIR